jgi:hypothetical protein
VKTSPVAPAEEPGSTMPRVGPPDLSVLPAPRPYRLQRLLDWAVLIAASPVLVPIGLLIGACVG